MAGEPVAAEGEARAEEVTDYVLHLLGASAELLGQHEFRGLDWRLDPHDYLVYDLWEYARGLSPTEVEALGALDDSCLRHMVADGLRRYLTPALRGDIERRSRALARRRAGSLLASEAEVLAMAVREGQTNPSTVGALVESFRRAMLAAAGDLPRLTEREWQERDYSLDPCVEALRRGSFARPAHEAVRRLQQAGQAALPLLARLCTGSGYGCDDYPFRAALEAAAAIPSGQSLWMLRSCIVACPILRSWAVEQLVAGLPGWACAYFRYLLTGPAPGPAALAAAGLQAVAAARCPDAFELARLGLVYRTGDAADAETVQTAAWEALLALGDPAAIPVLRSYLADEQASDPARELLLLALAAGGAPAWREEITQGPPVPSRG